MEKISIILKCDDIKEVENRLYFLINGEIDFLKMNVINDKIIIKGYSYNIENVHYILNCFIFKNKKINIEILEFSVSKEMPKGWRTFNDCVDSGKITIKFSKNEIKVIWSNDWVEFFNPIKNKNMFDRIKKSGAAVVATKNFKNANWHNVRDEILDIMEFLDNEELEDFEEDFNLDNGDCRIENPMYEFWDNFNQY